MQRVIQPEDWLEGSLVRLRLVTESDCTPRYVEWLADPQVNKYLETRFVEQTPDKIRGLVSVMLTDPLSYLFAIVERGSGEHVGNIKIGPINPNHLHADLSYFIGERTSWGKGLATDACRVTTRFAFGRIGLNRVQAGLYESNVGSAAVLAKAGFTCDARLRRKLRLTNSDVWEDQIMYCAIREEWSAVS